MTRDEIQQRRPKQPRSDLHDYNEDDSPEAKSRAYFDPNEMIHQAAPYLGGHKYKRRKHLKRSKIREDMDDIDEVPDDENTEEKLGLCCANCKCSQEKKDEICSDGRGLEIQSNLGMLWHLRCCHNVKVFQKKWETPMERAQGVILANLDNPDNPPNLKKEIFQTDIVDVKRKYLYAKNIEAANWNEDAEAVATDIANTNPFYHESRLQFMEQVKIRKVKGSAVVLDAFAGIGSAIVALKRIGIKISKIIHVEHDKVATHVYRWNHDKSYNDQLKVEGKNCNNHLEEDGITHVYYEEFSDVENNLDDILEEHGEIDIVVGGPPCVDFSPVNANRQGADGQQGKLMLQFGKLIQNISELQSKPCYFLAENTIIKNDKNEPLTGGDLERVKKAFNIQWSLDFDANEISPCRRLRTYLSNIPFSLNSRDNLGHQATICLEDGFQHPACFFEGKGSNVAAKANCFMAHKGRIDDERMYVFREDTCGEGKYFTTRCINTSEREVMMGFPKGYTAEPVNELFSTILNAFGNGTLGEEHWSNRLPACYNHFRGNFHSLPTENPYGFDAVSSAYEVGLTMAIPQTTEKPLRFNKEGYAKHLVGNAFSVPVVQMLLRPLKDMFDHQEYTDYAYPFCWVDQLNQE